MPSSLRSVALGKPVAFGSFRLLMRRIVLLAFASGPLGFGALHCHRQTDLAVTPTARDVADAQSSTIDDAGLGLPAVPSRAELCGRTVTVFAPLPGAKPFERPDGLCKQEGSNKPTECGMSDRYDFPPSPKDTCFVAQSNIDDAARKARQSAQSFVAPRSEATSSPAPPRMPPSREPWDGKRPPKHAARVEAHLGFTEDERSMLSRNGFVVLARKPVHSYVAAYHDIFQEQLPLYVTADSILHAVFRSEDALLEGIERSELKKRVVELVTRLRAALRKVPRSEAAEDVDLYLSVAARLSDTSNGNAPPQSAFGKADAEANELVAKMERAGGVETIEMYGRERAIDFAKYTPVGHYAGFRPDDYAGMATTPPSLSQGGYFRTMTWLSRHEWNLVSRGCQSSTPVENACSSAETPREARAALLLADLVDLAGARPLLERFETVYATFGGVRDDVPIASMKGLLGTKAKTPDALKVAIGEGYKRFAVTHPMPAFSGDHQGKLPAIATLLGARVAPDLDPVGSVMRSVYPAPLTANVFGALLGHDPGLRGAPRLQGHGEALALAPKLREASTKGASLYDAWMNAVLALGAPAEGAVPSFWKTTAHANLRMNSALVGYGQIRHNFVLMSGSSYDSYGCEIPDAYVEPHLAVYEALLKYAERGKALAGRDAETLGYFTRTAEVLNALISITKHELEGKALTSDETRYLGMVTEYTPEGGYGGDSHGPPKRMGWYYDLFTDRTKLAEMGSDFVGEVATNANTNYVLMLGAEPARLGVFVVDAAGEPRLMVGPVATGYEAREGLAEPRWTDDAAWKKHHFSDWARSYTASAAPEPSVEGTVESCDDGTLRVFVRSAVPIADSTLVLTDHHGDAVTKEFRLALGPEGTVVAVTERPPLAPKLPSPFGFGEATPSPFAGMHLRVGPHREGSGSIPAYDLALGPSVYHASTAVDPMGQSEPHLHPGQTYKGLGDFALGLFAGQKVSPQEPRP